MAKLNFIESQHPRMLSYVACRSDPVFLPGRGCIKAGTGD